ncbi:hypothetical protein SAMN04489798_2304 [Pseudomonas arsenicoxydans]|uniref:Uncharacterized protein n=1 Tax=Pseudomonas arsenicoxydans TaxID=702115 RepID=A0A1H0HLV1_9PSED|nr:hypothetical protein [Pseudomonas arsenicoxydans]SDO20034.1 hypothetical protein SAMN04489798_2304 [Pseudomonas arsenicoxydans]
MKLPLPTYHHFPNFYSIAEAVSMFAKKIEEAIKSLTAEPNIRFHSEKHLIQLVMYAAGLLMCEDSFKDVEEYLSDNLGVILRDYGSLTNV